MFRIFASRLFAAGLILSGAALMVSGHRSASKYEALRQHGEEAEAKVIALSSHERRFLQKDGEYTAQVSFRTSRGREIRTQVGVPPARGHAMERQVTPRTLTVRYLPEDPLVLADANDDPPEARKASGRYLLIGGVVLLVLGRLYARRQAG